MKRSKQRRRHCRQADGYVMNVGFLLHKRMGMTSGSEKDEPTV